MTTNAVDRAEAWRWGSLWARRQGDPRLKTILSDWPLERPRNWVALVNEPMTEKEVKAFQVCMTRNRPYGSETWQTQQARRLDLFHTLRNEGRPKSAVSFRQACMNRF